jgi:alpha-L-fucosidase 2
MPWPRDDAAVEGLAGPRARGGFTLDIAWKAGKLDNAVVHSKIGGTANVRMNGQTPGVSIPACGQVVITLAGFPKP